MRGSRSLVLLTSAVLVASGLVVAAPPIAAQAAGTLLVNETFGGASVPDAGWRALGDACVTHASSAPPAGQSNLGVCASRDTAPPASDDPGFLQLTDRRTYRAGGVVYDKPVPGNGGLVVEFDQWQYGGGGADGIGFFLTDGSTTLTEVGAPGGGLGYTSTPSADGVNGGYLGVGLDAWGNFASPSSKGPGCATPNGPGRVQNSVGLRGPGTGRNGYCWLTGTNSGTTTTLPGSLRGTSSADGQSRGVRITVTGDTFPLVTVEVDFRDGAGFRQVLQHQMAEAAPSTYKFGFVGATGSVTDTHLIRNVAISSLEPLGHLNIVKQIDNRTPQPASFAEGATIPYSFVVSNTSIASLEDVEVTDPQATNISCPATALGPVGEPDASMICTGEHVVTAADAAQSSFTNTATATGLDGTNTVTSNESSVTAPLAAPTPALAIDKRAVLEDTNGNGFADVGEHITYAFDVRNTGNVTVQDIAIVDPAIGGTTPATATLAPGATVTFSSTSERTVTQADVDAGLTLTNTAHAAGETVGGVPVTSPDDTVQVPVVPASPALTLDKNAVLDDANGNGAADAGETIAYSFSVRNTGNVTLNDVAVADDRVTGLSPASVPTLSPNEIAEFTADPYVVTQDDIDAGGAIENTATAQGSTPAGGDVESAPDSAQVPAAPQVPALFMEKSATLDDVNGNGVADAGESITYSFAVVNTGNVTLRDIVIADDRIAGTTPASLAELAPGGAGSFQSAPYVVTQADVDAGVSIVNTATAQGTDPAERPVVSEESTESVPVSTPTPSIAIDKTATLDDANGNGVADPGETISYAFLVTNNGNVTLTDVSVVDPQLSGLTPVSVAALAPNGTVGFAADSRVVTQADVDAGAALTNTAHAEGNNPEGARISSPDDTASVPVAAPVPGLGIVKTATLDDANGNGVADAGETIAYSFRVTNIGNVTLGDVVVDDAQVTGIDPSSAGPLAPGAFADFTADLVTVTQEDVDRGGSIDNTATARASTPAGGEVASGPSSTSTPIVAPAPGLTVAKEALLDDVNGNGRADAGEALGYRFTVVNTGNVTLGAVRINDERVTNISPEEAVLAPGAQQVFLSEPRAVTQAEIDAGVPIENIATASGITPGGTEISSAPSEADVEVAEAAPGISLRKTAVLSDENGDGFGDVGERVDYRFLVTNTGNVTLEDASVEETLFSGAGDLTDLECPEERTLAPGAVLDCTASYVIVQADIDEGGVDNVAVAQGVPPAGESVESEPSDVHIPARHAPALSIVKSADRTALVAGETVTYGFRVTNDGNVTLTDVAVVEGEFTGAGDLSEVSCPAATLAPGESFDCAATYEVEQDDVDAGSVLNEATATAAPPAGDPIVSDPSQVVIETVSAPALRLVKTADRDLLVAGETVTYTFAVTNIGNVTLSDVTVAEESFSGAGELSAIDCPEARTVLPGAELTCTATYTVQQADIDAGAVENVASANAIAPGGSAVSAEPSRAVVVTDPQLEIDLVKTADRSALVVGETVTYSFAVTNTGSVTLREISVIEGRFSGEGALTPVDCPAGLLSPGATVVCTASYTVTQADVDAGVLENTATAVGTSRGGDSVSSVPSTVRIGAETTAGIHLVKTADRDTLIAGERVTYSFAVTNTGTVTLSDIAVTETGFTGAGAPPVPECPEIGSLPPGAELVCTASYVATQADVDAGALENTAVATGTSPSDEEIGSEPSTVRIAADASAALTIVKSADRQELVAGDTVTFSFAVTNTGTLTLSDVTVAEEGFSGSGTLSEVSCPQDRTLAPGAQLLCTASYVVQQADVDAGYLENTASATGHAPSGDAVDSAPSTVRTDAARQPALRIEKTADRSELIVGETVTYSFLVVNTGSVTLSDVAVVDDGFSGAGSLSDIVCPPERTLLPGAQLLCTATYAVQQADVDAGVLENSATATAADPEGGAVISDPSAAQIAAQHAPGLSLDKSADKRMLRLGETVTYTFTVTNTGNVTVTDPEVVEGEFSGTGEMSALACSEGVASLAPGAQLVCTATYVVQPGDVGAGVLENTATARAVPPGTDEPIVSAASTATVPVVEGALPATGGEPSRGSIGLGALLLLAGLALFVLARGRKDAHEQV